MICGDLRSTLHTSALLRAGMCLPFIPHTRAHTHTHTRARAYTHTHTHTHARARARTHSIFFLSIFHLSFSTTVFSTTGHLHPQTAGGRWEMCYACHAFRHHTWSGGAWNQALSVPVHNPCSLLCLQSTHPIMRPPHRHTPPPPPPHTPPQKSRIKALAKNYPRRVCK